ncbi:MAG: hypothetical protein R3330_06620 [Saprospiraceae bacterium]|nr:hypothetical protein [Saprospiraceae bacterium]
MNTLTVFAPSGSPCSQAHSSLFPIEQLDPPGNTSGANFVGFFGAGGPQGVPFAIIVDKYQDASYVTNVSGFNLGVAPHGVPASGELNNTKFEDTNLANVNGVAGIELSGIPQESGTILIRFEPSGVVAVRTQNTLVRTVILNAASGVDDVTGVAVGLKVQAFEPGADNVWTQTAGVGALDNRLFIEDHTVPDFVHDFFVSLSASPEAVGERNDFGFFIIIEFL